MSTYVFADVLAEAISSLSSGRSAIKGENDDNQFLLKAFELTAASPRSSNLGTKADRFTLFPTLTPELRTRVWFWAALESKIVIWGEAKMPALFSTCSESRNEAKKRNTRVEFSFLLKKGSYAFYFSERDIIYRRAKLPDLVRIYNDRVPNMMSAFWCPGWSRNIKRLAMPLDRAASVFKKDNTMVNHWTGTSWFEAGLFLRVGCMMPELEELIIVIGARLRATTKINDVEYVADIGDVTKPQYDMALELWEVYSAQKEAGSVSFILRFMRDRMGEGSLADDTFEKRDYGDAQHRIGQ